MTLISNLQFQDFTLYTRNISKDQTFITVNVTNPDSNLDTLIPEIYQQIIDVLKKNDLHIVLERIFGTLDASAQIFSLRMQTFAQNKMNESALLTYIEGTPVRNPKMAGIQIRALQNAKNHFLEDVLEDGAPVGRKWQSNGATFIMLQNIHGAMNGTKQGDRAGQTDAMFERTRRILESHNATMKDVARTWIYLSDILDWYDEFNEVRTKRYREYGIIAQEKANSETIEEIRLPASTGIRGKNPAHAAGTMDVLAVIKDNGSPVQITPNSGLKQKSAFRYGSAFSRAMHIDGPDCTQILVSGTASIDETGETVYPGDTRAQITKTFEVVETLIAQGGATLKDICKATVFLKTAEDLPVYEAIIREKGLESMPSVCVVADVCRDDLLFELDAVAVVEKA